MIELNIRNATLEPTTFNADNRTVSVVFASNAPVRRLDLDGAYEERLDMSQTAVDLSELIGGPVLNSHNRSDVNAVLGVVESAQVDGERGTATIRFSERATAIMSDVRQGILRSVSVGYMINSKRVDKDHATGVRTLTATRWTPKEISFVAIPADSAAKVRGATMEQTNENEIRVIAQIAGLQADDMIARNLTLDQARAEAFDAMKRRAGPPIRTAQPTTLAAGYDDPVFLRSAMADAIYTRMNPAHQPGEAARPFVGRSMVRLAEEVLRLRGIELIGLSDGGIVDRALHSTSDFPLLLGDVANKVLREQMAAAPAAIKQICRQTTIPDFRNRYSLQLGQAPTLQKVNENGEFKSGTIGEGRESYKLDTYGRIFAIKPPVHRERQPGSLHRHWQVVRVGLGSVRGAVPGGPDHRQQRHRPGDVGRQEVVRRRPWQSRRQRCRHLRYHARRRAPGAPLAEGPRRQDGPSISPASSWWCRQRSKPRLRSIWPASTRRRPPT